LTKAALFVGATAVVVRLVGQLALGFYAAPETWEYSEAAHNIVLGRWLVVDHNGAVWHAGVLPIYPLMLAAFERLFGGSPIPIGIVQLALGAVLAIAIYSIGKRLGSGSIGLVAGLGAATHPGLVVYAAKVHSLNLDVALSALGVQYVLQLRDRESARTALALGLVMGAAALTRPTVTIATAVSAFAGVARRTAWRQWLSALCLACVVSFLIVGPWLVRNQLELGRFAITPTLGESLWRGNSAVSVHGTLAASGEALLDAAPEMRNAVWGKSELEQDAIFLAAATEYIREDPPRAVGAFFRRIVVFWSFGDLSGRWYPGAWLTIYAAYYVTLIALTLVGTATLLRRGQRRGVGVLMAALLATSLAQSVYYVEGRHRWSVEPLLLVLAAAGLVALVNARAWVKSQASTTAA